MVVSLNIGRIGFDPSQNQPEQKLTDAKRREWIGMGVAGMIIDS